MAFEVSIESLTEAQRFVLYENVPSLASIGVDPLEIIIELEQLAIEQGFADVHAFIEYNLNRVN